MDMEVCREFLKNKREQLQRRDDFVFARRHEAFLEGLRSLEPGFFESLGQEERRDWTSFFTGCHQRYLKLRETELALSLGHEAGGPAAGQLLELLLAGDAGLRRQHLRQAVDPETCRRVVMVGCGPFPATLCWLAEHYPKMQCVGIDTDPQALAHAQRVTRTYNLPYLSFELANGMDYDYSQVDFVYVANQVVSKRMVLERLGKTVGRKISALVRDPHGHGWLLADKIAGNLPACCVLEKAGPGSPLYLSRDLMVGFRCLPEPSVK